MRKVVVVTLIFVAGWGLGRYSYHHWGAGPLPSARPVIPVASITSDPLAAADVTPRLPAHGDDLARLLQRNDIVAVMERYESLQNQADEAVVAAARSQILDRARQLTARHRFSEAEQLLQGYLVAAYRDVEARVLLAETYQGQGDIGTAIDQLYEARGNAYRQEWLQRISSRIRSLVADLARTLKHNDDQNALRVLYQNLIQLEPDHAPWFMGLAATQLALDDKEAARRSLQLVAQDPDVGAQARAMLSELSIALAGGQATGRDGILEVVGIPLRRSGNHFIVQASPLHGRSLQLLIDTGASLTILTPAVLEQRGIRYRDTGKRGLFNTANGTVEAPIYKLDTLAVGDWQVRNIEIGVMDLGVGTDVDGLLGMNFLHHFQFFIDQNEALLRLSTK
jgi:clan AA aspartic protease (TIGR02281 family)